MCNEAHCNTLFYCLYLLCAHDFTIFSNTSSSATYIIASHSDCKQAICIISSLVQAPTSALYITVPCNVFPSTSDAGKDKHLVHN